MDSRESSVLKTEKAEESEGLTPNSGKRKRAAFACKPCNARRLKCDAVECGTPCSRCRSLNREQDCELHQSRRGKYPRTTLKANRTAPSPTLLPELSSLAMISDVAAASQPLTTAPPSSSPTGTLSGRTPVWAEPNNHDIEEKDDMDEGESREASPTFSTRPPSPKAPTDMIYANFYEDGGRNGLQGRTAVYVGLPTHNLAYLLGYKDGEYVPFLHSPSTDSLALRRPISAEEVAFHRLQGYYDVPTQHVEDQLIKTYFHVFHPTYPILDRVQFARSFHSQISPPSLLLLHAMFMAAAGHCSMELIQEAGFKTRQEAKRCFYCRAKALFHADYEPNRVINIQATFILQFYWESPIEQKDAHFWLKVCINFAQHCGMHRSTARAGLPISEQRLWRRIWNEVSVRDSQMALAFGKPMEIQEYDCDVGPMTAADFVEEGSEQVDTNLFGRLTQQNILYSLNMMRLHKVAYLIGLAHGPSRVKDTMDEAKLLMQHWSQTVEPEMQYETNSRPDFWVRILHIWSNYLNILMYRSDTLMTTTPHSPQASRAANFVNLLFDEIMTENEIALCPTHLVPALFAAMLIHLSGAGFLEPSNRTDRIAKNRLRVSMLAMKEMSAYWPVCTWIFQLFAKIIKERSGRGAITTTLQTPAGQAAEFTAAAEPTTENIALDEFSGNWAEIEAFTSSLMEGFQGLDFDFSQYFDVGTNSIIMGPPVNSGPGGMYPPFMPG